MGQRKNHTPTPAPLFISPLDQRYVYMSIRECRVSKKVFSITLLDWHINTAILFKVMS